jgi:hypothetical protein
MKNRNRLMASLALVFRPKAVGPATLLSPLKPKAKKEPVKKGWDATPDRKGRSSATHLLLTGQKVKFSDGRVYLKKGAGNLVRVEPRKPYRNRAEQKQYLKARRREREAAAAAAQYGSYQEA